MAETFLALRRGPAGFEQRVCLKRILPAFTAEPRFVELFLDEARLLAHMHSASIVQVFDFGEADGTYYMALELVDGSDLEALLRSCAKTNTRLPISVALYIAAQLLSALDYAHNLSVDGHPLHIVHRDISPSNVLLSKHGEVKLTDFGIAKSRQRTHKTRPGQTKGKLAYMCPEQVRGDPLDARSDLFSVGVVLYEMLAGAHPFVAGNELKMVDNILSGQRPNLRALVPEVSLETKQLVDRLLGADAATRPESAREALKLLPLKEQPFQVQRKLAELVSLHCSDTPAAREPNIDAGAEGPLALLPTQPMRVGPERSLAAPVTLDARRKHVPARDARGPRRRFSLWMASALGLAAASALLVWSPLSAAPEASRGPRRVPAAKAPATTVPVDVTARADAGQAEGTPTEQAEVQVESDVQPAANAEPSATPDQPEREERAKKGRARRASARRAKQTNAAAGAPALPVTPPDTEPRSKGRSGLSVRADEF
jgi:serine/threonine-protein kinase